MAKISWFARLYISAVVVLMAAYCATETPKWLWIQQVRGAVAQPFYLERESYERNQGGALSMYSRQIVARSTDGTTAIVDYSALDKLPPGVRFPPTRKVIKIDGSAVWMLDDLRIKVWWPKMTSGDAKTELALMANHDPDCGADKSRITAREYLKGHSSVAVVSDLGLARQLKVWVSPEFGCEGLQSNITLKADGTVLVDTRLVKAELGEPDARLFDLGDGYRQGSMIDLLGAQLRAVGEPMNPEVERMAANFERERNQVVPEVVPIVRH
jgi:hypothetical protein